MTAGFASRAMLHGVKRAKRVLAVFVVAGVVAGLAASSSASAAPARCKNSNLVVWLDNSGGGGTAGSFFYELAFTNLSGHACTLRGRPGVVAVGLHGGRVGSPASTGGGSGATVRLDPGETATAQLRATDPGVFTPSECHPTLAAGLRVTPPGQKGVQVVPFPLEVCSRVGHTSLEVQAVKSA
jgi:hypothetical protein